MHGLVVHVAVVHVVEEEPGVAVVDGVVAEFATEDGVGETGVEGVGTVEGGLVLWRAEEGGGGVFPVRTVDAAVEEDGVGV